MGSSSSLGPALAAAVAVSGCGMSVGSTVIRSDFVGQPTTPDVAIHASTLPECKYVDVGTVRVVKNNRFASEQECIDALKAEAKSMGGDAVVGFSSGMVSGVVPMTNHATGQTMYVSHSDPVYTGVVVRFVDRECVR